MSKDTTFVHGTIVRADYLNADQEANTGAIWSTRLAQNSSSSVETNIIGDPYDTQGPLIVGGKHAWKNGASTAASASGPAGDRNIWVKTNLTLLPDYQVEVMESGDVPSEPYYRKIGSGSWDGVSSLSNLKFENGVQADANQYNQFTLKTISSSSNDVALTIEGYSSQETSTVARVGYDDSGFQERLGIRGDGLLAWASKLPSSFIITAGQSTDLNARWTSTAAGELGWGDGTLSQDVFLSRTSAGVLKVSDGTSGGNGIFDLVALQNSDTGGAAYNGAGMINILDDLNIQDGNVLRYNGIQFDSSHLADASSLAHLTGTETFTGTKTFSVAQTFEDSIIVSESTGVINREGTTGNASSELVLTSQESSDSDYRLKIFVDGTLNWGDGSTSPDVTISRTAANEISLGSGDHISQAYSPSPSEPNVLVNRSTLDAVVAVNSASKAFSLFIA